MTTWYRAGESKLGRTPKIHSCTYISGFSHLWKAQHFLFYNIVYTFIMSQIFREKLSLQWTKVGSDRPFHRGEMVVRHNIYILSIRVKPLMLSCPKLYILEMKCNIYGNSKLEVNRLPHLKSNLIPSTEVLQCTKLTTI